MDINNHPDPQGEREKFVLAFNDTMLKIWQELYELSPVLFTPEQTGPFCQRDYCKEGKMSCGNTIYKLLTPSHILRLDYPALFTEDGNEN